MSKRLISALLCVGSGVVAPGVSMAAGHYYADVSYEYQKVELSGVELNPYTTRLKLGTPRYKGFGIEASYAFSANDDTVNQLKLEVNQQTSLHVRYQGEQAFNGVTIYLLMGESWTTLKTSGPNAVPDEEFKDLSWGIGAEDYVRNVKNMFYSVQYTRYYSDANLTISGISLGLRYNF
ncbi:MAG: outer membrane beta-barrel protein [Gammaproteobacteria bacterium]